MFGLIKGHQMVYTLSYYVNNIEILTFIVAVLCAMPIFNKILEIKYEHKVARALVNIWLMILFVLSSASIVASTYNPFIYFRF